MSVTKVTNDNIVDVSAETVSGTLPALNASAVLNMPTGESIIESANDPAFDSDLELGKMWLNTTNGEMFVCTDATPGLNVWKNIAAGSDHVAPPFQYAGTQTAWIVGGHASMSNVDNMETFSLTSDGNATMLSDVTMNNNYAATGTKSNTSGYILGGGWPINSDIEKYSFESGGDSANVGTLNTGRYCIAGFSTGSHGYGVSGLLASTGSGVVDKFSYSNEGSAVEVGNMPSTGYAAGVTGPDNGYIYTGNGNSDIEKYTYASDSSAVHSTMYNTRYCQACHSTSTHGYSSGGHTGSWVSTIDKFSFANTSNAVHITDLAYDKCRCHGYSSETHGYTSGGSSNQPGGPERLEKFSFASETTATIIGSCMNRDSWSSGTQF